MRASSASNKVRCPEATARASAESAPWPGTSHSRLASSRSRSARSQAPLPVDVDDREAAQEHGLPGLADLFLCQSYYSSAGLGWRGVALVSLPREPAPSCHRGAAPRWRNRSPARLRCAAGTARRGPGLYKAASNAEIMAALLEREAGTAGGMVNVTRVIGAMPGAAAVTLSSHGAMLTVPPGRRPGTVYGLRAMAGGRGGRDRRRPAAGRVTRDRSRPRMTTTGGQR